MIGGVERLMFAACRWLREVFDPTPRISRRRAEDLWQRLEMDRHPIERVETWPGEDGHYPLGVALGPGDVRKRPVFAVTEITDARARKF